MFKLLKLVPYFGVLLIAIGFLAAFTFMYLDNDELTKVFISIIPVGFLILFVGVVTRYLMDDTE